MAAVPLTNLTISSGALSPSFSGSQYNYTDAIVTTVTSVTVTPTISGGGATITVNGVTVTSGSASASIPVSIGSNIITIITTAISGGQQLTYTITVIRAGPLTGLLVNSGTLSPAFVNSTTSYTLSIPNTITSLVIVPTSTYTITVTNSNSNVVTSGTSSLPLLLNVGTNVITVSTADPSTTSYTLTVMRNPALSGLTVSSGTLSPAFNSAVPNYTLNVTNDTSSITVTPTSTSTIYVNGIVVSSGVASGSISLAVGSSNVISILAGTLTYVITVTRASSSYLSALTGLTLSPSFLSATTSYTATVSNSITSAAITPTSVDSTATIIVNGITVLSGSSSGSIPLLPGSNLINIAVTSQDHNVTNYTITVTRTALTVSSLSSLTLSHGTLSSVFAAGTLTYTATVAYAYPSVTVTPTVTDSSATVKVNGLTVISGSASSTILLLVGNSNTITVLVTAQDNSTTTYIITVTRLAASHVSTLSNIVTSGADLVPSFSSAITAYQVNLPVDVASLTLTSTCVDANAKIDVEGDDVLSGVSSAPLDVTIGNNQFIVSCTAEDGTSITTYSLNVTRADFSDSVPTFQSKSNTLGGSVTDVSILDTFEISDLQVVNQVQNLADCTKNLPHRLMEMGIKKAEELLLNNPTAASLLSQLDALAKQYDAIKKISELASPKKIKPETLIEALLAAQGLTGMALVNKINDILNNFAGITGLSDILNNLNNLDVCKTTNYLPGGSRVPNPTNIPLGTPPPAVEGVVSPVANASYNPKPKDDYDAFIFQLKEHLNKDSAKVSILSGKDLENYNRMLAVLNTLAYSYHDNISRTTDDSKDAQYKQTYLTLVADELNKHAEWDGMLKTDYSGRASVIENEITRNTSVIRAFYNRDSAATGDWMPLYMTAYGNASIDRTTASEVSSGKLTAANQFEGRYHSPLVPGISVASNYWTGNTILEIRYAKDKTPVGSGRVTVHDTGGMSNNVIDYYCGDDLALYNQIQSAGINTAGKTKPGDAAPIEVRVVSGGPKSGKTV